MVQKNQKEGDLVIFNFGKKKVNTEAETATTEIPFFLIFLNHATVSSLE